LAGANIACFGTGAQDMQDMLWIAITIGLLALTLAYFRLCEKA
jgi:hypothetical protein